MSLFERIEELLAMPERVKDTLESLSRQVMAVANNLSMMRAPKPEPTYVVVWGMMSFEHADGLKIREYVFSIPVEGGRAIFQPQRLFKLQRWLLLGPGRVTEVMVGQQLQGPTTQIISGIVGREGNGDFDTADVGVWIRFMVS